MRSHCFAAPSKFSFGVWSHGRLGLGPTPFLSIPGICYYISLYIVLCMMRIVLFCICSLRHLFIYISCCLIFFLFIDRIVITVLLFYFILALLYFALLLYFLFDCDYLFFSIYFLFCHRVKSAD